MKKLVKQKVAQTKPSAMCCKKHRWKQILQRVLQSATFQKARLGLGAGKLNPMKTWWVGHMSSSVFTGCDFRCVGAVFFWSSFPHECCAHLGKFWTRDESISIHIYIYIYNLYRKRERDCMYIYIHICILAEAKWPFFWGLSQPTPRIVGSS